ncbi:MAG: orotidine-5'-phosphate decarboxylase [Planctomycetaceae bacterium]|jgi:orotidine-5'-phosphate decarboxylase|nr:orotidine-5'-phosphate decarboxylase [Phycisphaerales bacterium]MCE2654421.1 orotidine-5'-phosphate decarboxylase [Planctomycetaceae bacterium]
MTSPAANEKAAHKGTAHFADRLAVAIDRCGSPVCVGLDPVATRLPADLTGEAPVDGLRIFSMGVIEAVAGVAPAVKIQAACFERYGAEGVETLEEVAAAARLAGLVVVLDAKRGDIGVTAEHYAQAAFGAATADADALTVNAYLGTDTLEPYLALAGSGSGGGRGIFVLVRTSNPGSDGVQGVRLADGRTVAEMMADHVAAVGGKHVGQRGLSAVGAVVGATKPQDGPALRSRMPNQIFLVPGYGAQGGTADDVRGMLRSERRSWGDAGVLVTASRSVIYAWEGKAGSSWEADVRAAAEKLAKDIAAIG